MPSNATITGIAVKVYVRDNPGLVNLAIHMGLMKSGVMLGDKLKLAMPYQWPFPDLEQTEASVWGHEWTPAEVNSPSWGATLRIEPKEYPQTWLEVDSLGVIVYYTVPPKSLRSLHRP